MRIALHFALHVGQVIVVIIDLHHFRVSSRARDGLSQPESEAIRESVGARRFAFQDASAVDALFVDLHTVPIRLRLGIDGGFGCFAPRAVEELLAGLGGGQSQRDDVREVEEVVVVCDGFCWETGRRQYRGAEERSSQSRTDVLILDGDALLQPSLGIAVEHQLANEVLLSAKKPGSVRG